MQQIVTKQNQAVAFVLLAVLDYFLVKHFLTGALEVFDFAVFTAGIAFCFVASKFYDDKLIPRDDVESPITKVLNAVNICLVVVFFAGFTANVYKIAGQGVVLLFAQFALVIAAGWFYLNVFRGKDKLFAETAKKLGLRVEKTRLETEAVFSEYAVGRIPDVDNLAYGVVGERFVRVGLCKATPQGRRFSLIIAVSPLELFEEYEKAVGKYEELKVIEKASRKNLDRETQAVLDGWWRNFAGAAYVEGEEASDGQRVLVGRNVVEFEEELQDDLQKQLINAVKRAEHK